MHLALHYSVNPVFNATVPVPLKNVAEQSLDSGTSTMATVSTGFGRSSKLIRSTSERSKSTSLQGDDEVFVSRSSDHLSDVWPRHSQHPPSPPVRQRARYIILLLI